MGYFDGRDEAQGVDYSKRSWEEGRRSAEIKNLKQQMLLMEDQLKKAIESNRILEQDRNNLYVQREALKLAVRETILTPGLIEGKVLSDAYGAKYDELIAEESRKSPRK